MAGELESDSVALERVREYEELPQVNLSLTWSMTTIILQRHPNWTHSKCSRRQTGSQWCHWRSTGLPRVRSSLTDICDRFKRNDKYQVRSSLTDTQPNIGLSCPVSWRTSTWTSPIMRRWRLWMWLRLWWSSWQCQCLGGDCGEDRSRKVKSQSRSLQDDWTKQRGDQHWWKVTHIFWENDQNFKPGKSPKIFNQGYRHHWPAGPQG